MSLLGGRESLQCASVWPGRRGMGGPFSRSPGPEGLSPCLGWVRTPFELCKGSSGPSSVPTSERPLSCSGVRSGQAHLSLGGWLESHSDIQPAGVGKCGAWMGLCVFLGGWAS